MWFLIALFLFNMSVFASGKISYCGSKLCRHTNAHSFCQFSDGPGPQCMGFMDAPLSDEEKMRILARLNLRRAAAAEGRLKRFPGASNMMKLMWVEELAREAQLWANQCEPPSTPEGHDACRDLYSVTVGQCVASVVGEAPGLKPESMVDLWYMQNMFYKGNVSYYIPPSNEQTSSHYGEFAQLLYAQSYMVGCGRSRFMVPSTGRMRSVERLVCNLAPRGPSAGRAVWTAGVAAGNCPPRSTPDDHIPALCTFQHELDESVDQDHLMSLEAHILLDTIFEIKRNDSLNYVGSIDEIYLTKAAVVSMKEIVAIQDNGVQKRNVYDSDMQSNAIKHEEKVGKNILRIVETTDVTKSIPPTATLSTQQVKLIGRPRSYNMDDLNYENDIEEKTDNRRQISQEYPASEKEFDLDYEFTDFVEEPVIEHTNAPSSSAAPASSTIYYRTVTTETTPITSVSTVKSVRKRTVPTVTTSTRPVSTVRSTLKTTPADETKSVENFTVSTKGLPRTPFLFTTMLSSSAFGKIDNNDTVTMNTNETDALLEEYLNDPETVKRLQEELDRLEKVASTSSLPPPSIVYLDQTERSEKVRRAISDERQQMGGSEQITIDSPDNGLSANITDEQQYDSSLRDGHGMYSSPKEDRNETFDPPMYAIAKKYLPFLYKNNAFNNRALTAFEVLAILSMWVV